MLTERHSHKKYLLPIIFLSVIVIALLVSTTLQSSNLHKTQDTLAFTQTELTTTQSNLTQTKTQLTTTQVNLAQTQADLATTRTQLNTSEAKLASSLQPPYTSISGRQITCAWCDSTGSLQKWTLPVDTYRAFVEIPKPTQTVTLKGNDGTWQFYDYRPYIVTSTFSNVIQDYSKNFTDGMTFAKEIFNLVTQLTTYSSTDTARWPVETMTEAGGDCKDLSILFASLLKASNFPYQLRLVYMDADYPNAPVKPNHCIVEVTYSGQTIYVDCTSKQGWGYWSGFMAWFFSI